MTARKLSLRDDATVVLKNLKGKLEKYNGAIVHPHKYKDQWVVKIEAVNKELVVNDEHLDVNLQKALLKRRASVSDGCQPSITNGRNRSSAKLMMNSISTQLRTYIKHVAASDNVSKDQAAENIHARFDMDGNGTLDRAELFQAFDMMKIKVSKEEFDLLFSVFDSNADGGVSITELLDVVNDQGHLPASIRRQQSQRLRDCEPPTKEQMKKQAFAFHIAKAEKVERKKRMKEKSLRLPDLPDVRRANKRKQRKEAAARKCSMKAAKNKVVPASLRRPGSTDSTFGGSTLGDSTSILPVI